MDKKSAALLAMWSTSLANSAVAHGGASNHAQTAHGHATLRPVVCDTSSNYPSDGASARLVNDGRRHQFVLTLSKPENSCSDKGQDGVYVGGRVDAAGFPANWFACTVSEFVNGEPIFSVVVRNPDGTSSTYVDVPYTTSSAGNGVRVTSDLGSLGLSKGTRFLAIYAWVDVVSDIDISNFTVDGVAVTPSLRVPLGFDCTGIFPSFCGSCGSPGCGA